MLVAQRVSEGGHSIPEDVIVRRYKAGIINFHKIYKDLVDDRELYDNSQGNKLLFAERKVEHSITILDNEKFIKFTI